MNFLFRFYQRRRNKQRMRGYSHIAIALLRKEASIEFIKSLNKEPRNAFEEGIHEAIKDYEKSVPLNNY